jgi:hypothetical protein
MCRPFSTLIVAILISLSSLHSARGEEGSADPEATREVSSREWKRLKKIVPFYFWLHDPLKRRKSKVDATWAKKKYSEVRLTKRQFAEFDTLVREGNPFTTEKNRGRRLMIPTGEKGKSGAPEQFPVKTVVPSRYKPGCGKAFPLVITCHGGPAPNLAEAEKASATQFSCWSGFADSAGCIVAAPALPGETFGDREWTFLKNLIEKLDRLYNVDRDRVLLTGHSWGGILTWHVGPPHADTFCTLAPFVCAVNPGKSHLMNCRALPIYHVQGRKDIKWIVDTGRERNKVLSELGYEHVYREKDGGHDVFPDEISRIAKYFRDHPREMYAKKIVRRKSRFAKRPPKLWYWVKCADRDFEARIDSKKGVVSVDVDGPFEVYLHDRMVDLDKEVTIERDGEVVWKGRVVRRLEFTLNHVRETGDKGRVFAASVKID